MRLGKILLAFLMLFSLLEATQIVTKPLEFTLEDIKGNTYHIKDKEDGLEIEELKGKVVFLAFFGHRCPPCRMEIPGFISFSKDKEYAKKSAIFAIEVQGYNKTQLKEFAKNIGINYILVPGSENIEFINYIAYRTNWNNAIPFMVVIDQNGTVVNYGNGIISEEELKAMVDELTQTNQIPTTTTQTSTTNQIQNPTEVNTTSDGSN